MRKADFLIVLTVVLLVLIPLIWFGVRQLQTGQSAAQVTHLAQTLGLQEETVLAMYTRCGNLFGSCYRYLHAVGDLSRAEVEQRLRSIPGGSVTDFDEASTAIFTAINTHTTHVLTLDGLALPPGTQIEAARWQLQAPDDRRFIITWYAADGVLAFDGVPLPLDKPLITIALQLS